MGRFGLLGEKLGHSVSPDIHALFGGYEYGLYEVSPEDVHRFLAQTGLDGMNVTIPYKITVMENCAELSDAAQRIGSVNTLMKTAAGWYGDNTDYHGFRYMVGTAAGYDVRGKAGVVFGNGGAARAVLAALDDMGAGSVTVVSRRGPVRYEDTQIYSNADFIVNTTPVGMAPHTGKSVQTLDVFANPEAVFDLIYNPVRTALLKEASERGIVAQNGLSMLVAQAAAASEVFTGNKVGEERIRDVIAIMRDKMKRQEETS